MPRIISAMTTCPRKVSYLDRSLASVRAAGFSPLIVEDEAKTGSWTMFRRALQRLLETEDLLSDDALVVFQDDIEVSAGLFGWLEQELWPGIAENAGVVSLYTAAVNNHEELGWHEIREYPEWKPYGACAYVVTAVVASDIVFKSYKAAMLTGTDTNMGLYCQEFKMDYWMHSPSFVRHIGEHSSLGEAHALVWDQPLVQRTRQCGAFCENVAEL